MYQLAGFDRNFLYADINEGLDYERAVEMLNARAGRAYRSYFHAKRSVGAEAERVNALYDAYCEALRACRDLSPHDSIAIREILTRKH